MSNPYPPGIPIWQLYTLMESARSRSESFGADAKRFIQKAQAAAEEAEALAEAIRSWRVRR